MALPNSYTQKIGALQSYFDAILNAEAPDRFTNQFLTNLGFKSTNDRMFLGILKELGFIDPDGLITERYLQFLDRENSYKVLAEGIREAYADLFLVNKKANELTADEAYNKLRTLYGNTKKTELIQKIAKTFAGLCEIADFSGSPNTNPSKADDLPVPDKEAQVHHSPSAMKSTMSIGGLQYHINIILPNTKDQSVYDAIFKSLRDHLGQ